MRNVRLVKTVCFETVFIKVDSANANLINSLFGLTYFREYILHNVDISNQYLVEYS